MTSPDSRRVHLLMYDAGGGGGVARTVINLANHLVDSHEVELVSLFRHRDAPRFPVDPKVRLTYLDDIRPTVPPGRLRTFLRRRRTLLRPHPVEREMSLLTDLLLWRKLRSLRAGVLISTRPSLHLAVARLAPRRLVTIGQDHLNFPARFANSRQARVLRAAIPRLDGYTVLTHADAADYRRELPGAGTPISVIRNALPWPVAAIPAALECPVVVAAGRLSREKGFDRLVRAFEPVARAHPDWQLHIYGHGPERAALTALVAARGLEGQVLLQGYTDDLRSVLAEASVFAMSSHSEGFPMVLIEAMSVGLPLVSFDCPRGPGEIIEDHENGRLLADDDLPGFTEALLSLVEDPGLRRRLGARALEDARHYEPDRILAAWQSLFTQLEERRRG